MKKSLIIAIVGVIIVGTVILCAGNKEKAYEKNIVFTSPNDILEVINNEPIGLFDNQKGYIVNTTKFLECLSKRKRITSSNINYEKINVKKSEEDNTEEIKGEIINSYRDKYKHLYGLSIPEKVDSARVVGYGSIRGFTEEIKEKIEIDIVFIDEGEGWVIDYFWISNLDEGNIDDTYN